MTRFVNSGFYIVGIQGRKPKKSIISTVSCLIRKEYPKLSFLNIFSYTISLLISLFCHPHGASMHLQFLFLLGNPACGRPLYYKTTNWSSDPESKKESTDFSCEAGPAAPFVT